MYKLKEMIKSLSNELSITLKEIGNLSLDVEILQNYRHYDLFSIKHKNSNQLDNLNLSPKIGKNLIKEKDSSIEKEKSKEKEKENKLKYEMLLLSKSEKINETKQDMKNRLKELEEKKYL